jgi:hypothetical protein
VREAAEVAIRRPTKSWRRGARASTVSLWLAGGNACRDRVRRVTRTSAVVVQKPFIDPKKEIPKQDLAEAGAKGAPDN